MISMYKICLECNIKKAIGEYYKHSNMTDGYLNTCKECKKKYSKSRVSKLRNNPEWVKKKNKSDREAYYRLGYRKRQKEWSTPEYLLKTTQLKRLKYPEKTLATGAMKRHRIKNGISLEKDSNYHHWSYNEIHFLDTIKISTKDHYKLHRYMIYDQSLKMYRIKENNELLDTKEKHLKFFESIKNLD